MLLVNATNFPLRDPSVRSAEILGGARAYLFDDVARVAGFDDWRPAVEAGGIRYKQMASLMLPGLANADNVFRAAFPVVDYPTVKLAGKWHDSFGAIWHPACNRTDRPSKPLSGPSGSDRMAIDNRRR